MSNPMHTIVHLTMKKEDRILAVGSGVLFRHDEEIYIATAWHNLTGRHSETLSPLSNNLEFPDSVEAVLAVHNFGMVTRMPITIDLEDDNESNYYIHKESWPRKDVALLPISLANKRSTKVKVSTGHLFEMPSPLITSFNGQPALIKCIQDYEATSLKQDISIDVSEDIFVVGYPAGIKDFYYSPIWKRATVASSPSQGWNREPKFLIDCASKQGMSGAPAIRYFSDGAVRVKNNVYHNGNPFTIFEGIYVGRMGGTSEFEAQIGVVWKRKIIEEILESKIKAPKNENIPLPYGELKNIIINETPMTDEYAEMIGRDESTAWGLVHSIMEKINGAANPNDVFSEVISLVKSRTS